MELHSSRWPTWLGGYQKWFYAKRGFSAETFQLYQDTTHKWEEAVDNLYNLEVAIIEFPRVKPGDATAIDEVCTVFEKMNSTGDAIAFYTLEDHHIFPKSRLAKKKTNDAGKHHKYESEEINTILNRTLISEGTHRSIRDRWPSVYIPEIVPPALKTEIVASHFIDEHALTALESDKYDAFREHRERCILAMLRKYLQA